MVPVERKIRYRGSVLMIDVLTDRKGAWLTQYSADQG